MWVCLKNTRTFKTALKYRTKNSPYWFKTKKSCRGVDGYEACAASRTQFSPPPFPSYPWGRCALNWNGTKLPCLLTVLLHSTGERWSQRLGLDSGTNTSETTFNQRWLPYSLYCITVWTELTSNPERHLDVWFNLLSRFPISIYLTGSFRRFSIRRYNSSSLLGQRFKWLESKFSGECHVNRVKATNWPWSGDALGWGAHYGLHTRWVNADQMHLAPPWREKWWIPVTLNASLWRTKSSRLTSCTADKCYITSKRNIVETLPLKLMI